MNSKVTLIAVLAGAAFGLAACGGGSSAYGTAPSAQPSPSSVGAYPPPTASPTASPVANPTPAGVTIATASTRLGKILVDSQGRTLYLFVADKGKTSVCNSAACVQYWPPLLTKGAPKAGAGVNAMLLGTTKRADGTTEVTYAGHPLYYFIADKKAGDVTGQGVDSFGGPWYVVSPAGAQIDS
jgi:predicted lipoprotein with Yx(FWY)xxD motif